MQTQTEIERRAAELKSGMARGSAARLLIHELRALRDKAADHYRESGAMEWFIVERMIHSCALECRDRLMGERT